MPKPGPTPPTFPLLRTLLCVLALATTTRAQTEHFLWTTNNGTITIFGAGWDHVDTLEIPATINGLPVTRIGNRAFEGWLISTLTMPDSVVSIGPYAFSWVTNLFSMRMSEGLTSIGERAFEYCSDLPEVVLPAGLAEIGAYAFGGCGNLRAVKCKGNAPKLGSAYLGGSLELTVYYLPGTTGWGATFGGRPTAPWFLPNPVVLAHGPGFGVQPGGFGFTISWATNSDVVVEACGDLVNPGWLPLATNTLVQGSAHFSDPEWGQHSQRLYRVREK